ncbi:MAG: hypothetical protein JWQ18_74 [Conexibacter sp.]|nr:hypothetical protein [Conexibacter sp.]
MAKPNRRTVAPRGDQWAVEKPGSSRASSLHSTQKGAQDAARKTLNNTGGGELVTQGRDGKIREKDTVGRPDPFPPRG